MTYHRRKKTERGQALHSTTCPLFSTRKALFPKLFSALVYMCQNSVSGVPSPSPCSFAEMHQLPMCVPLHHAFEFLPRLQASNLRMSVDSELREMHGTRGVALTVEHIPDATTTR